MRLLYILRGGKIWDFSDSEKAKSKSWQNREFLSNTKIWLRYICTLTRRKKSLSTIKRRPSRATPGAYTAWDAAMTRAGGTEADPKKAAEWYKKAMELGVDAAYNNMGILYKEGRGVEKDREAALECFIKSADMDNKAACGNAAVMLSSKKSSAADDMTRKYAEKSKKSSKESKYVLAVLKAEGRGEWPNVLDALEMLEELMDRHYAPAEKAYYKYLEDMKNPGEEAEKLYQDELKEGDEDYLLDAARMGHIKACEKYLDILYNSVFNAIYENKILYERTVQYAPDLYEILKNGGIDYPKEKFDSVLILFSQMAQKLIKEDDGYKALRLLKKVEKYDDLHCKYMMIHAYHAIAEDYNAKAVIKEVMARTDVPDWMMEECRKNLAILKDE